MSAIDSLLDPLPIPRLVRVGQTFPRPVLADPARELHTRLEASRATAAIRPGQSIAIAVGSRGISQLPLLVRTLVTAIRSAGGVPFIIPAMGSHAGATAEGQQAMLAGLGVSEATIGAPVRASMETVVIGKSENGLPVHVDRLAWEAGGIVILNRIKPHVAFRGPYESGLMKMLSIGLGKQHGADVCHELGFGRMAVNIPAIGRVVLEKARVLFAVSLIENGYHELSRLEVLSGSEIEACEPGLLDEARRLVPRLYFDQLDVAVIDEIGKDISGTGFDTNFIGRYHTPYASGGPQITRLAVLDITERSHGNGSGLGMADFTTRRAFAKFDFENTYPNSLTTTVPLSVKIPMVLKNDRQAIQAAIKTCNILDKTAVRLVRLRNTIDAALIDVSENLVPEVLENPMMAVLGEPRELIFNDEGDLF